MATSYERMGDRAPTPCDIGDAHGVAQAFMQPPELTVTPLPFRHPELLDNEVRIRVVNSGLCHSDVMTATNSWGPIAGPFVAGHEFIGIVEKVGQKVTKLQEGDRVGVGAFSGCCNDCENCGRCRVGRDIECLQKVPTYNPWFGGNATSWQGRAKFVHKVPDSIPSEAAPLFCAGATVFSPLFDTIRPGDKVGIGGIGGLGHLGLQFASKLGCEVTAFSRTPDKEAEARSFGADHFVVTGDEAQSAAAKRTMDVFLETATSMNISKDAEFVRPGGSVILVGLPNVQEDVGYHLLPLVFNNINLKHSLVASVLEYEQMLDFAGRHKILPKVSVYPFAETQAGYNSLALGQPNFPRYRNVIETESFLKTFTPAN